MTPRACSFLTLYVEVKVKDSIIHQIPVTFTISNEYVPKLREIINKMTADISCEDYNTKYMVAFLSTILNKKVVRLNYYDIYLYDEDTLNTSTYGYLVLAENGYLELFKTYLTAPDYVSELSQTAFIRFYHSRLSVHPQMNAFENTYKGKYLMRRLFTYLVCGAKGHIDLNFSTLNQSGSEYITKKINEICSVSNIKRIIFFIDRFWDVDLSDALDDFLKVYAKHHEEMDIQICIVDEDSFQVTYPDIRRKEDGYNKEIILGYEWRRINE